MPLELKIPEVGESIHEVEIGRWLKSEGQWVDKDENLVEIETDKASVELPAPESGYLVKIIKFDGDAAEVGDTIAHIEKSDKPAEEQSGGNADKNGAATSAEGDAGQPATEQSDEEEAQTHQAEAVETEAGEPDEDTPAETPEEPPSDASSESDEQGETARDIAVHATPGARRALREHGLTAAEIDIDGDRRVTEDDVRRYLDRRQSGGQPASTPAADEALEEVVPMSIVRRSIARRLVEAQQQAALLTTFNEIDMTTVMELRRRHRESFQEKYGVKLGFMGFFVKAVVDALRAQPAINAQLREKDIVYHNYYHIGIAIGGGKGLVVPILRYAERMSFAEIEGAIADFAERAQQGKIKPDELQGGTFTISNGGVYGSLLSTPIVNPPQSGVLGMHTIQERPVALEGEVVIRPMMYIALTYDHRLVDGREAVTFLRRIKETLEEPSRMLLEV